MFKILQKKYVTEGIFWPKKYLSEKEIDIAFKTAPHKLFFIGKLDPLL
jgi:hypothetical protein